MAVGFPVKANYATGDVLTATNMNDLSGTVNTLQSTGNAAGKNAIINGGFDTWQRSTSAATSTGTYPAADRWWCYTNSGSATMARESTVIPDGARYSAKITSTGAGTQVFMAQAIETSMCSPFIGKTVTVSGQLAASTSTPHTLFVQYSTTVDDGNSGSWTSITAATTSGSLTPTSTTFVSFANTYAIPSTAKTVRVALQPTGTVANGVALYYGNIQLEVGSSASTFSRAGATIQGELAACQRYYQRLDSSENNFTPFMFGAGTTTTNLRFFANLPVTMRTSGNVTTSAFGTFTTGNGNATITAVGGGFVRNKNTLLLDMTTSSSTVQRSAYSLEANNSAAASIEISSEL